MCQVDEEYHDHITRHDAPRASTSCVKCKEACAAVVVRVGDAYCRICFKEFFTHKFRAMLGKTRLVFPGEKVLLAVSGGPSSSSMLALVQEGLSQKAHKKLRFTPGIVYIDEGGAVGLSMEERQKTVTLLQTVFKDTGFPFYIVPLEQVLDLPTSVLVAMPPSHRPSDTYKAAVHHFLQSDSSVCVTSAEQENMASVETSHTLALQRVLSSAQTLTARDELLSTLRQHLLVHKARTEGYSKLMMGDSCTRLAVKLLTSISLGRGAQVAQDTGFSDSRYGDIITVRPMRDYTAKEIAFYNHLFNVSSVATPTLDTKAGDKASIQRLTESFVTKLQVNFPSTVSTIYRSDSETHVVFTRRNRDTPPDQHGDACLLCMCTMDASAGESQTSSVLIWLKVEHRHEHYRTVMRRQDHL
uniref:Cytoplasmic tRNA 2-thiolation protein 2 n=1 Tax=Gouania willdenowi TaxID=441366 RepID=A0A8C5E2M1_GOUWI